MAHMELALHTSIKAELNAAVTGDKGEGPFEISFSQLPEESMAVLSMSDGQMSDGQTHVQTHDVEGSWVNVVKTNTPQEVRMELISKCTNDANLILGRISLQFRQSLSGFSPLRHKVNC